MLLTNKWLLLLLYFSLDKVSKEVVYHAICVNYEAKIEAGTGAGPKWWLRLQPKIPWLWNPAQNQAVSRQSVLRLLSHANCHQSHISCLKYPVSRLLSQVSCLKYNISRLLPQVPCLTSPVSHLLSQVSCLKYPSQVSCLKYPVPCLTSPGN